MARVAVASKDGVSINLHFGHASEFWIYQQNGQDWELLERREVDHYCHGHTGDQSAMQKNLHTISDCSAVFVAKIGDGPVEKLRAKGIESVDDFAYLGIEESLKDYSKK